MSEIKLTNTSNTLWNDSQKPIAFAEQIKQQLINWAEYTHVTEELGQNRPDTQNLLNNLFLSVYEKFLTFLNDADATSSAINTWKEIERFLADYTDTGTLKEIVDQLNSNIESRLSVVLENSTGSSTTNGMSQKAITDALDAKQDTIADLGAIRSGVAKVGYYECDSLGNSADKAISVDNYALSTGGSMKVKMTNANTADNATLNINSTGAKPLFYDGERASANNSWEAGETVEIYYDGTSYYANNVAGGSGSGDGAFDVSTKYPTSGVEGGNTYTLEGALAVLNANLPASKKKGGMSVKFIQSSDNKYVQYFLTKDEWSVSEADWQKLNLEDEVSELDREINDIKPITERLQKDYSPILSVSNGNSGLVLYDVILYKGNKYLITNKGNTTLSINVADENGDTIESLGKVTTGKSKLLQPTQAGLLKVYSNGSPSFELENRNEIYYKLQETNEEIDAFINPTLNRLQKNYAPLLTVVNGNSGVVYYNVRLFAGNEYEIFNEGSSNLFVRVANSDKETIESLVTVIAKTSSYFTPTVDGYLEIYCAESQSFRLENKSEIYYHVQALETKAEESALGAVYDVSAHNDNAVFESLSALLSNANLSTLIPTSVRCGGMSIRFIQGSVPSSDKYVQYRYMGTVTDAAAFTDVTNWQGVDDEPTAESHNLVTSGGVFPPLNALEHSLIPINGKVSIIGDSISTYSGTMPPGYDPFYPNSDWGVTSLYDMWWHLIISSTKSELEVNASWGGTRVTDGLSSRNAPDFYDRTNILGSPDCIFVALGTNDSLNSVPLGTYDYDSEISELSESEFIPAYIKGVKALKINYPNTKIVLFVFRMADAYADVIKNIGDHYNIDVIDVRSYYVGVHPNKLQMCAVAQTIFSFYIKQKADDGVSDRFDVDESNLYGKEILEEEFEATANTAFQKIYPCLIKKGYVLDIDIEHNRTSRISINFMDENENILQSTGNVPEDDFPLHLTAAQSSSKIRFAAWSGGSVTVSGKMTFKVKIIGELPKIKDDIITLNSTCNNLATEIDSAGSREKKVVGRYIPKLEARANNVYISVKGVRVIDEDYYVSKSIALHAGDTVLMKNPAGIGNFALISTYDSGTDDYTPVYINNNSSITQRYTAESDFDAYFTIYKNGTEIIIDSNSGISGELNSIEENCPDIVVAKNKITITSAGTQQHRFSCPLKKGDLIYVKLIDSKIDTAAISLMDSNDNAVYSSGNLSIWKYPHQICVPEDCSYMRLAVWNASWIIETGDMTVLVKKYNSKPLSIQDSLQTDTNTSGDLLAIPCRMIKDGAASPNNYAVDGVHYEFDVENNFSKLYLYFEWQPISALADGIFTVAKLFNGKYRNYYSVGDMTVSQCGNVYRTTQYGNDKEGTNTLKNFAIPSGLDGYDFADAYFSFAGKDAIWIRYTGENRTAVSMNVKSDGIVVTVGEDSRTFNFASSDLLSTVIDTISAETDLEAGWYKCGSHTFGELLKNDTLDISLLQEIPASSGIQDIITNPRVYLPLALDEEWHSCEILVDIRERIVNVNTDGFNTRSALDSDVLNVLALDKSTICIGDAVDSSNCPVRFRNLDLQIDSDGGAEIINYSHCVPQKNGTTWRKYIKRMISPRNPNVVIYEGHGVIVGKDSDVDPSTISFVSQNGMACTTDRLMNILAKAKDAGYEFVSFQDILEWKLYGKRLPKRCMAMMFDDFRIDNYLDYDKKYPFTKYGITPGLAIVTKPSRDLDEEVTYNGLTCTYREAMQIIKDAGWYLSSHSYDHRNHVNMQYSDRLAALKLDDIYAKPYRVQLEVFTYSGNNYDYREDSSMKAVPVSIGIGGEVPDYICKGSNQYNLTRYDCGLRISYADSIAQLV